MKKRLFCILCIGLGLIPTLKAQLPEDQFHENRGPGPHRDGEKKGPRTPPPPVMEYLEQLRESDPEEFKRLEDLQKEDPQAFRNELRTNAWKKSEGQKHRFNNRPHPLKAEIEKVRNAETPEAKAQAIEELRIKVRERVEENLKEREAAIEKFRRQLKQLEEQNEQERIRLEEIIDHHLERILTNIESPQKMSKWTPARIRALKGKDPFATVTVFDYTSALFADRADLPYLLVGDSLGMTVLGHSSTLPVTMDVMIHHTAAVMRGVQNALVVSDLPFMSYQVSDDQAVQNAGRLLQEAGADAVKLEGGAERTNLIRRLVQNGIPVTGHIGLTPQSVKTIGYQVQGKSPKQAERMKQDALALQDAGVFSLVIEACPADLAAEITASLEIPTIGIGAGPHCDGQVLVYHDLLGLFPNMKPKFVKQYAQLGEQTTQALQAYQQDVKTRTFPGPEHCYP